MRPTPSPSPERVLIVEDEPIVALLAETACQDAGMFVCGVAISEDAALALASLCQPTCAVVDVQLAPGDGRRVAQALRRDWRCAVVFTTAYDHDLRCNEREPCVLMAKPYPIASLVAALEAARRLADGQDPRPLPVGAELIGRA